jgi:hypothetical protein
MRFDKMVFAIETGMVFQNMLLEQGGTRCDADISPSGGIWYFTARDCRIWYFAST